MTDYADIDTVKKVIATEDGFIAKEQINVGDPVKVSTKRKYIINPPDKKLSYHEKLAIIAGLIKKISKYDSEDFEVEFQ